MERPFSGAARVGCLFVPVGERRQHASYKTLQDATGLDRRSVVNADRRLQQSGASYARSDPGFRAAFGPYDGPYVCRYRP